MKKIIVIIILLLGSVKLYETLERMPVMSLVTCSNDSYQGNMPSFICRFYLYNFKSGKQDIASLNSQTDLTWFMKLPESEQKMELITFFVDNGLSVNPRISIGLSPLFLAVYNNDAEMLTFLMSRGVNLKQRNNETQWNLKTFIKYLSLNNPELDRTEVRLLLKRWLE